MYWIVRNKYRYLNQDYLCIKQENKETEDPLKDTLLSIMAGVIFPDRLPVPGMYIQ
jgi:hypothetical protein